MTAAPSPGDPLRRLNAAAPEEAYQALLGCCASTRWARRMASGRPYAGESALLEAAARTWWELSPDDWREALCGHPRIGETAAHVGGVTGGELARREQAGVLGAPSTLLDRLSLGNRRYEERFGHIFVIRARGRDVEEMLEALESRLGNDPARELEVAAGEQAAITGLRLQGLVARGRP
ncbi:MAG: 2-oxo-4-hydroxy-4-carboxy-5-ureidoimidazoline decarboxylase [Candidatus Dormibacteraceae bacterium]